MDITLSITLTEGKVRHILTLPKNRTCIKVEKDILESIGFKIEDIENGLYLRIILPEEWQFIPIAEKKPSYFFYIVDKENRKRLALVYIDSDSIYNLHILLRYSTFNKPIGDEGIYTGLYVVDNLNGTELYYAGYYKKILSYTFDHLYRKAENYLNEHYPDWGDPTKYWDD